MRWKGGRRSANVEDRRGSRVRGGRAVKGGIGTIVITFEKAVKSSRSVEGDTAISVFFQAHIIIMYPSST